MGEDSTASGQFFLCDDTLAGYMAPDEGEDIIRPIIMEALVPILHNREKNGWQPVQVEIPEGVTAIGTGAFEACFGLTDVVIPDTVVSIGSMAFCDCISLAHLRIPDSVREIQKGAFIGCSSLADFTIPHGVRTIGEVAFCRCTALTHAIIPDTVETLGYAAFAMCTGLQEIYVPETLCVQGKDAFGDPFQLFWSWLCGTLRMNAPLAAALVEDARVRKTVWDKIISEGNERTLERYLAAWDRVPLDLLDELIERSLKARRPEYTALLLQYKSDQYLKRSLAGEWSHPA